MSTSDEYDRLQAVSDYLREAIIAYDNGLLREVNLALVAARIETQWLLKEKEDQLDNE